MFTGRVSGDAKQAVRNMWLKFKREGTNVDRGYGVVSVEEVIKTIRDQESSL